MIALSISLFDELLPKLQKLVYGSPVMLCFVDRLGYIKLSIRLLSFVWLIEWDFMNLNARFLRKLVSHRVPFEFLVYYL